MKHIGDYYKEEPGCWFIFNTKEHFTRITDFLHQFGYINSEDLIYIPTQGYIWVSNDGKYVFHNPTEYSQCHDTKDDLYYTVNDLPVLYNIDEIESNLDLIAKKL